MPHVVLLGLMGAGKTSIGTVVAERLGLPLVDGDERLAEMTGGRTAAEISEERGLDALHALEAEIAIAALDAADPAVIGPASSVCESAAVRDALSGHVVIWLSAPVELPRRQRGEEVSSPAARPRRSGRAVRAAVGGPRAARPAPRLARRRCGDGFR